MPKKKFDESTYDPIASDIAREVAAMGRTAAPAPKASAPSVPHQAPATSTVVELRRRDEPRPAPPVAEPRAPQKRQEPTIAKRFVVTRSEDEDMTAFLHRLSQKAGTKITLSVLSRTCLSVAMHAEEQLLGEIANNPPPTLPSTHDSLAYADFEDHVTDTLITAFRKMPRRAKASSEERR